MLDFSAAFSDAMQQILSFDSDLADIVFLSLQVSLSAVVIGAVVGMPLGALLAVGRFPGRGLLSVLITALMGLPPVVLGLGVYLVLSASGPLGVLGLLYTPTAMIIAQALLVIPIIAALTRQQISDLHGEYDELLRTMGASGAQKIATLLWDGRYGLLTAGLAGLGRAFAEVGAVMIVGGNINHVTRVMTTTIALETSRGNLALALALGVILLALSFVVTGALMASRTLAEKRAYA